LKEDSADTGSWGRLIWLLHARAQLEVRCHSIRCISRAAPLPFEVIDAGRTEEEMARLAASEDDKFVAVSQDVRLDNRWIDLRTPAMQAAFRIQSAVCQAR
jgi:aspartyl-tRNA synthetase